jgi:hypothetical protein
VLCGTAHLVFCIKWVDYNKLSHIESKTISFFLCWYCGCNWITLNWKWFHFFVCWYFGHKNKDNVSMIIFRGDILWYHVSPSCVSMSTLFCLDFLKIYRGRRGRDDMVVGFTTTYAYHHYHCEFESRSGEVYSIQHYVIKFVSGLQQVNGFLRVLWFPPPIILTATI